MKKITITLNERAAAWVRVQAANRNMSLSRYVGEMLREKMGHTRQYEQAMRAAMAQKPLKLEGPYLKRDELYARPRRSR